MRTLSVFVLAASIALVVCYDEKFDKIDVDKILGDESLFEAYINCMLDKGSCEKIEYADEYKKMFPEIVETACAKCTPIQKAHIRSSVKALHDRRPAEFEEFRKMYDPEGKHQKQFADFVLEEK